MKNLKLTVAKYGNQNTMRVIYVLLGLLAMMLAGGAPDAFGGG